MGNAEQDGFQGSASYARTFIVENSGVANSVNAGSAGPHFVPSTPGLAADPSLGPTMSQVTDVGDASSNSGGFELASGVDAQSVVRELQSHSMNSIGISLRERFCRIFGIVDDSDDAHAQGILTKVDEAAAYANGRRTTALRAAITQLVGPLNETVTQLHSGGLEKNAKNVQQYIRFQDGRQVFSIGDASTGGQGSVQIVVNPALSPTDHDLFQVVKIPGQNVRATLHPETHEFDSIGRAHDQPLEEPIARLNTEAAILQLLSDRGLSHISPRLIDRTVTETGAPALISEYIRGRDLNALVKEGVRLTPQAMYDLMAILASHLHELHTIETDSQENTNGVVHRDLKPANIMLTADGQVRIIDFGLARYRGTEILTQLGAHTKTNTVSGTGAFIAPEQVGDVRHASYAADTYSLAATMAYLVTGKPLYAGANDLEMAFKHANVDLEPVDALKALSDAGVDLAVVDLVRNCLHKTVDASSGEKRLARKQDGRPTMQEILVALAPRTTWGKRNPEFAYAEGFTKAVRSGSVRFAGMLSQNDARSIGITRPLPDGFRDRQEFVETFAKQYPVEAQQKETRKKVSGLIPKTFLAGGAITALTAATIMFAMKGSRETNGDIDVSGVLKGSSTAPENPGSKLRTAPEVVNVATSSFEVVTDPNTHQPTEVILFKGKGYEMRFPKSEFIGFDSDGKMNGFYVHIGLAESQKLLGRTNESELPQSFIENNGTNSFVLVDNTHNAVLQFIPGVGYIFTVKNDGGNETTDILYKTDPGQSTIIDDGRIHSTWDDFSQASQLRESVNSFGTFNPPQDPAHPLYDKWQYFTKTLKEFRDYLPGDK